MGIPIDSDLLLRVLERAADDAELGVGDYGSSPEADLIAQGAARGLFALHAELEREVERIQLGGE